MYTYKLRTARGEPIGPEFTDTKAMRAWARKNCSPLSSPIVSAWEFRNGELSRYLSDQTRTITDSIIRTRSKM